MSCYRLTREAADDVVSIYLEGIGRFGDQQAAIYHEELERTFDLLANYPKAGRSQESIGQDVRILPFRAHIIVYRPDPIDHVRIPEFATGPRIGSSIPWEERNDRKNLHRHRRLDL